MISPADSPSSNTASERQSLSDEKRPVEVGLVIVDRGNGRLAHPARHIRRRVLATLQELLPEFSWQFELVRYSEPTSQNRQEPVALLERGVRYREEREWDFVVVVTESELVSRSKPFCLAAVSRALDAAVVSTAAIESGSGIASGAQTEELHDHLSVLILHAIGHLAGLGHSSDPNNLMHDLQSPDELDAMVDFDDQQISALNQNLREIADLRLEEEDRASRRHPVGFYLEGAWCNRHEIFDAVREAHPWEFPLRLGRLSTAAFSSVVLLLLTAETWDLAMNQTATKVALLMAFSLIATTAYVVVRQRLLVRRPRRRLTEQIVITNSSAVAIVAAGMATVLAALFIMTLSATLLFSHEIVESWAATLDVSVRSSHYITLAAFVASIGVLVGALGASFEEQHYFRHVIFVDEET